MNFFASADRGGCQGPEPARDRGRALRAHGLRGGRVCPNGGFRGGGPRPHHRSSLQAVARPWLAARMDRRQRSLRRSPPGAASPMNVHAHVHPYPFFLPIQSRLIDRSLA